MVKKLPFFILLLTFNIAFATKFLPPNNTISNTTTQELKNVLYNNGNLYLKGFNGPGVIEVYSIIGNKITDIKVQELGAFQLPYILESGNMYIVRVVTAKKVNTFKVVAS